MRYTYSKRSATEREREKRVETVLVQYFIIVCPWNQHREVK